MRWPREPGGIWSCERPSGAWAMPKGFVAGWAVTGHGGDRHCRPWRRKCRQARRQVHFGPWRAPMQRGGFLFAFGARRAVPGIRPLKRGEALIICACAWADQAADSPSSAAPGECARVSCCESRQPVSAPRSSVCRLLGWRRSR